MIPVLKRLSIGKKLAVISITLTAVLVALSTYMLYELKDTMIEGRKLKLRGLVESAVNVVNLYRSEEHTSELQSLMRISYAVFCLKKKTATTTNMTHSQR